MNKNTIIGFIAIGVIMFGFSWYQSNEAKKQLEQQAKAKKEQQIKQAQDALLASEQAKQEENLLDVEVATEQEVTDTVETTAPILQLPYMDTLLNKALDPTLVPDFHVISNDVVEIKFTTKGAQPYSVRLDKFKAYKQDELMFVRPGWSDYDIKFDLNPEVAGSRESLNTKDFTFKIVDSTASQIVMQLPFEDGYIQQKYWIEDGSYMLKNELSVVGINKLVPAEATEYHTDWKLIVPRLEKSYSNEKRYSKLDYYCSGDDDIEEIAEGENDSKSVSSFSWFAFQQQFFSAIMTPADGFQSGRFVVSFYNEKFSEKDGKLMNCNASLASALNPAVDTLTANCDFYFGPNDYKTLKSYGRHYEDIIPLGSWFVSWFNRWVIIPVFDFLGKYIDNYGIIILLLTLLIKLLLSPLTIKSYKSTAKMQALRPELQAINEKYPKKEDAMKKQQAIMNLYQKAGVSPLGGCLPLLLQMPILFAMFRFFPASVELRQESFLWAEDLSSYDAIISFGHIPLLGDHISLFAFLMAASMFFYSKMNSAQVGDGGMPGMKFMSLYLMPIMMFFICNSLPAALSYYYLLSNLITMAMTWYIRKYVVTEEKVRAEMARAALKPRKKSKWQLRLEEAQRMQEQMQKQKKNRK